MKLQNPCNKVKCDYRKKNKNNEICLECHARWQYVKAQRGDKIAIQYMDTLTKAQVGLLVEKKKLTFAQSKAEEKYQEKYYKQVHAKVLAKYGKDCPTLAACLSFLSLELGVRTWVARFIGVPEYVMRRMAEVFAIPAYPEAKTLSSALRWKKRNVENGKKGL